MDLRQKKKGMDTYHFYLNPFIKIFFFWIHFYLDSHASAQNLFWGDPIDTLGMEIDRIRRKGSYLKLTVMHILFSIPSFFIFFLFLFFSLLIFLNRKEISKTIVWLQHRQKGDLSSDPSFNVLKVMHHNNGYEVQVENPLPSSSGTPIGRTGTLLLCNLGQNGLVVYHIIPVSPDVICNISWKIKGLQMTCKYTW